MGKLQGLAARRFTFQLGCAEMQMHFREVPEAIRACGVDAMLVDQVSTAGSTIAESCGLRFVTLCNALPLNREDSIPPFFTGWRYRESLFARLRNRAGNGVMERFIRPAWNLIQAQRRRWGLSPYLAWSDIVSPLAQLSQRTVELDFPRTALSSTFHYLGPWREPAGSAPPNLQHEPFPFGRLTRQPLILSSRAMHSSSPRTAREKA